MRLRRPASAPSPEAGSALWYLEALHGELLGRTADMQLMDDYYNGNHPLPFLTPAHADKLRNEFRQLLDDSRSNFMQLIVDAVEERLNVEGIRLSARSSPETDERSWKIWQANQMDAEAPAAVIDALVKGVSYLSVWKEDADEHPMIAVEDPMQTIVGYVPGSGYRKRAAALKVWSDGWTGVERANVYLPERIVKFQREAQTETVGTPVGAQHEGGESPWKPLEADSIVNNPIGVVPIVPLRNRGRVRCEGKSEIDSVYRIQNQINGFLFLLALAGYFGAHRQRWGSGVKLTRDDAGNIDLPFDTAIDRLWVSENPEAKFGEFQQTDLDGYIKAIEQKVLHIAVITRTPRHYLIQEGQSPSGDAIKSAESGLTKKVSRKMRPFGEGFEEALRLARRFDGATDDPVDSEVVWADPEIRTDAERTDAASKKVSLGLIDRHQALEDLGYTQTQIARMLAQPAPEVPADEPDEEPVPV